MMAMILVFLVTVGFNAVIWVVVAALRKNVFYGPIFKPAFILAGLAGAALTVWVADSEVRLGSSPITLLSSMAFSFAWACMFCGFGGFDSKSVKHWLPKRHH